MRVEHPDAFASLASGGAGSCGVTTRQTTICWGFGRGYADVMPVSPGIANIAFNGARACGLEPDGSISCWSMGGLNPEFLPTEKLAAPVFSRLAGGRSGFCAVGREAPGYAYCWGSNGSGQLGDGTTVNRLAPTPVVSPIHE